MDVRKANFMNQIYSVADVTASIRELIDNHAPLQDIWVTGEISNLKIAASGHWYFTLKDENARLRCVMFRYQAARQVIQPDEGDSIQAHGNISVYDQRGEYQLYVDEIQPAGGIGELYRRFDELKQRLLEEGLFDDALKKPLPRFPRRIGVVTSPDAAAFRDIQHVLARRFPLADVILSPTLVQGHEAPPQIVQALQRLNAQQAADVILLSRGGGSIEDLWSFNDEQVARAVIASEIPIVSGVGHETDTTIVDFVADIRAPTPSAAAEVATPSVDDLEMMLRRTDATLQRYAENALRDRQTGLHNTQTTLQRLSPQRTIQDMRQRVDDYQERLSAAQMRHLARLQERLTAQTRTLNAASPMALLERGYAIITRDDTRQPVSRTADAPPGTDIAIRLKDGFLSAQVTHTEDTDTDE
jgi:exodeoxyribonuclease VII large subunit